MAQHGNKIQMCFNIYFNYCTIHHFGTAQFKNHPQALAVFNTEM